MYFPTRIPHENAVTQTIPVNTMIKDIGSQLRYVWYVSELNVATSWLFCLCTAPNISPACLWRRDGAPGIQQPTLSQNAKVSWFQSAGDLSSATSPQYSTHPPYLPSPRKLEKPGYAFSHLILLGIHMKNHHHPHRQAYQMSTHFIRCCLRTCVAKRPNVSRVSARTLEEKTP